MTFVKARQRTPMKDQMIKTLDGIGGEQLAGSRLRGGITRARLHREPACGASVFSRSATVTYAFHAVSIS